MIIPSFLQYRDLVAIVAPGRKVKKSDIEDAITTFEAWGVRVVCGDNLFSDEHQYLSASDERRLSDLQRMMDDPGVKAIICARGGYGTTRILDQISLDGFRQHPKWIAGFSDITALHLRLFKEGFASIHGTMPVLFSKSDAKDSVDKLRQTLFGNVVELLAEGFSENKPGQARGQLIGGNLSLVTDALGTHTEIDTAGKILLIEEVDEYHYKIDRMLTQLKRAGKLHNLAGLVIGHFTDIKDPALAFGETVVEIILHHTAGFDFPVAFRFPVGHEHPNLPFVHGGMMELSVSADGASLRPF